MSDVSQLKNNLLAMFAGKVDFNGMLAADGAVIQHRIAQLAPAVQPVVTIAYDGFKAGASALVGLGESALGQIVSQNTDTLATAVLNMLQAAGVPTSGPLSIAEHAAAVSIINGCKTYLESLGIDLAVNSAAPPLTQTGAQPE